VSIASLLTSAGVPASIERLAARLDGNDPSNPLLFGSRVASSTVRRAVTVDGTTGLVSQAFATYNLNAGCEWRAATAAVASPPPPHQCLRPRLRPA
jgi:hypothetical protein